MLTKQVTAKELPSNFQIPSTYHLPVLGRVVSRGRTIRVRIFDDTFTLKPKDRVIVVDKTVE